MNFARVEDEDAGHGTLPVQNKSRVGPGRRVRFVVELSACKKWTQELGVLATVDSEDVVIDETAKLSCEIE